mmetsp:Transcript_19541/g.75024  ORF Transcript_19541/g.75024 Transcript_19541/m.75024 type:complete len:282 (-) Transcript_19541:661-1506(-)
MYRPRIMSSSCSSLRTTPGRAGSEAALAAFFLVLLPPRLRKRVLSRSTFFFFSSFFWFFTNCSLLLLPLSGLLWRMFFAAKSAGEGLCERKLSSSLFVEQRFSTLVKESSSILGACFSAAGRPTTMLAGNQPLRWLSMISPSHQPLSSSWMSLILSPLLTASSTGSWLSNVFTAVSSTTLASAFSFERSMAAGESIEVAMDSPNCCRRGTSCSKLGRLSGSVSAHLPTICSKRRGTSLPRPSLNDCMSKAYSWCAYRVIGFFLVMISVISIPKLNTSTDAS